MRAMDGRRIAALVAIIVIVAAIGVGLALFKPRSGKKDSYEALARRAERDQTSIPLEQDS